MTIIATDLGAPAAEPSRLRRSISWTGAFWVASASADATSFFFILAVSNRGYIFSNFLNLNAGWIRRIDSGHIDRPFKAPTFIIALGVVFAFVNAVFMGAGATVWNPMAPWAGLIAAALIFPVFFFRRYVRDKGKFPAKCSRTCRSATPPRCRGKPASSLTPRRRPASPPCLSQT